MPAKYTFSLKMRLHRQNLGLGPCASEALQGLGHQPAGKILTIAHGKMPNLAKKGCL